MQALPLAGKLEYETPTLLAYGGIGRLTTEYGYKPSGSGDTLLDPLTIDPSWVIVPGNHP
jgi:hypothetical protein